jgi:hypothetical protein
MAMDSTDTCKLCEKIVLTLETKKPVKDALELPHTYDAHKKVFVWKFHEFMGYAMVPQVVDGPEGRMNIVELFLCIDEDDLDDIDVEGYAKKFIQEKIMPEWKNIKQVHCSKPVLNHPENLECRKMKVYQKVLAR